MEAARRAFEAAAAGAGSDQLDAALRRTGTRNPLHHSRETLAELPLWVSSCRAMSPVGASAAPQTADMITKR